MNVEHFETSEYPHPRHVVHGNRRGTVLHCPMVDCQCVCYTYVAFHSHVEVCHQCEHCSIFVNKLHLHQCTRQGEQLGHIGAGMPLDLTEFAEISRSQRGAVALYRYRGDLNTPHVDEAFGIVQEPASRLLTQLYDIHSMMKLELILGVLMERKNVDEDGNDYLQQEVMFFVSKHEMYSNLDIDLILLSSASEIFIKLEEFLENSSDWYVKGVQSFDIKYGELRLFQNARPRGYLPMPITGRKGFCNLRTKEPICFQLSVCASVFWNEQIEKNEKNNVSRGNLQHAGTWKRYMNKFDWTDVTPELDIYNSLQRFEQRNNICVNIFTEHKGDVVMMRKSENMCGIIANLFLIVKRHKTGNKCDTHFAAITEPHKFLGKVWPRRAWFCQRCFRRFASQRSMYAHTVNCMGPKDFKPVEKLPREDDVIEFKRFEMSLAIPVVIFYDYEGYSVPVPNSERQKGANTTLEYKYEPASYALCVAVQNGDTYDVAEVEYYDGERPVGHFYKRVFELGEKYLRMIRNRNNFVQLKPEQLLEFEASTECHFCHREFTNVHQLVEEEEFDGVPPDFSGDDLSDFEVEPLPDLPPEKPVIRTMHHLHWTGDYQFPLCRECNLRISYKHEIPVLSHYGSSYDHSLLLSHLHESEVDYNDVKVLAKSSEKIIEIKMAKNGETLPPLIGDYTTGVELGSRRVKIRFLDNGNFLPNSLSDLSSALAKDGCRFWHMLTQSLPSMLPHLNKFEPSHVDLLLKKLPYCYQYLSSPDVLKPGHPLPPRDKWDNDLKREKITDAEWELVHKVCETFQIHDLRTFTRIYTILDTVLLCIINTNFRSICMELYELEPLSCCTLPGYGWNAMLKVTKSRISMITDRKMITLVEESIRGGISGNAKTYAEANNPLQEQYDPDKEDSYIIYYDINSLYATAMTHPCPVGDYKWVDPSLLKKINWKTYDSSHNNNTGYFLRVSLRYPPHLAELTSELVLAPEKYSVQYTELPTYHREKVDKLNGRIPKTFVSQKRLIGHCFDRLNYCVHHSALKYYVSMGIEILDIIEGFSFREEPVFKKMVEFTADKRRNAKSNAWNKILKLILNSNYGKSLLSNKERHQMRFSISSHQARHLLSLARCCGFKIINGDVCMAILRPPRIVLNNPIWLGATILDISKVLYFTGFYNKLKTLFGDRCEFCIGDTDSYVCRIADPDKTVLQKHVEYEHLFDFSTISNPKFFEMFPEIPDLKTRNAGKLGLLKIEGLSYHRGIFLKPKVYYLDDESGIGEKRAKGVMRQEMKSIDFGKYADVAFNDEIVYIDARLIRSFNHNLFNIKVRKLGFHSLCMSRAFIGFNSSLPWGHPRLPLYCV